MFARRRNAKNRCDCEDLTAGKRNRLSHRRKPMLEIEFALRVNQLWQSRIEI